MATQGRNSPCQCGSGKKYKACCLGKVDVVAERSRLGGSLFIVLLGIIGGGVLVSMKGTDYGLAAVAGSIIIAAAVYVFRDPNPPRGGSGGDSSAINFGR